MQFQEPTTNRCKCKQEQEIITFHHTKHDGGTSACVIAANMLQAHPVALPTQAPRKLQINPLT
jgi:hypothetical protein